MNVLVIRHAIAADAAKGQADEVRPLTVDGRNKMRRAAKGLATLVPKIDVLVSSPLVRAVETASIVAREFPKLAAGELDALVPGTPAAELCKWIAGQKKDFVVAVVGHEPDLSRFVGYAICGKERSVVELKKGAALLLTFAAEVAPGKGQILWALTPGQLRALGK